MQLKSDNLSWRCALNRKLIFPAFAFLMFVVLHFVHITDAAGMSGTLFCSCTQRNYDTPNDLLPNCTRPVLTRPGCGAFLPVDRQNCQVLKRPNGFKAGYDAVVLGRTVTPSVMALGIRGRSLEDYAKLVGLVIDTYHKPWTRGDVYIEVTRGAAQNGEYARVDKITSARIALIVRGAIFSELSPAAFIAKIGHEMIHVEQVKREYRGVRFDRINDIVAAMNELEASSWETVYSRFAWRIGPNELWDCETNRERDFAIAVRGCREWQIKELLLTVNQNRSAQDNFAAWIEQNPWARAQWLPRNRDWRNLRTNNAQSAIPIPSDPGRAFDCSSVMGAQ
jgi:hypothetical protein